MVPPTLAVGMRARRLSQGQSMGEVLLLVAALILVLGLSSGPFSGLIRAIAQHDARFVRALSLP